MHALHTFNSNHFDNQNHMDWPNTKDGKLFDRLKRSGVDFNKPHSIVFNVDFYQWPPPADAINELQQRYEQLKIYEPGKFDDQQEGFVALKTNAKISYEFVTDTQREVTELVNEYGGYCNSWALC